jgi:hypothetical protein
MIFELLLLGAPYLISELAGRVNNGRMPRCNYAALVGWWYGSFAEESPGALLASMIDSDLNCDQWKLDHDSVWVNSDCGYVKFDILKSNSYKATITYRLKGRAKLVLEDKQGKNNDYKITAYEDYLLSQAKDRWKKRKTHNEAKRVFKEHMDLVNERINQNYLDTLTMIENRILNSGTEVTDPNLQALLPAPDHPIEAKKPLMIEKAKPSPQKRKKVVKDEFDYRKRTSKVEPHPGDYYTW